MTEHPAGCLPDRLAHRRDLLGSEVLRRNRNMMVSEPSLGRRLALGLRGERLVRLAGGAKVHHGREPLVAYSGEVIRAWPPTDSNPIGQVFRLHPLYPPTKQSSSSQ